MAALAAAFAGCTSADAREKNPKETSLSVKHDSFEASFKNVNSLRSGIAAIEYTVDNSAKSVRLSAKGPHHYIEALKINVNNGCLEIDFDVSALNRNSINTGQVRIKITGPELRKISLARASELKFTNNYVSDMPLNIEMESAASMIFCDLKLSEQLFIDTSSAASLQIGNLETQRLVFNCSSASNVKVQHVECDQASISVSSASEVKIPTLEATSSVFDISSTGVMTTNVDVGTLSATISSQGVFNLSGKANTSALQVSSMGEVNDSRFSSKKTIRSTSNNGGFYQQSVSKSSYEEYIDRGNQGSSEEIPIP